MEVVTVGQERPVGQGSQRTLPEHDTHEPSGQGCAALMPVSGQMKPVGQMVWLAAPSWGQ